MVCTKEVELLLLVSIAAENTVLGWLWDLMIPTSHDMAKDSRDSCIIVISVGRFSSHLPSRNILTYGYIL